LRLKENKEEFLATQEYPLSNEGLADLLQAALAKGACFRFQAKGLSMAPFIRDGDIVVIAPLNEARVRLGDILVFIHPSQGKLAIHRLIKKRGALCLIKGDNVSFFDGWVERGGILGRVISIQRGARKVCFGLGPERYLIVFFSRTLLLSAMLKILRRLPLSIRELLR